MRIELRKSFCFIIFIVGLISLTPDVTYAYLDAATGSIIFQAVVAVIAGASFFIRLYWKKLKVFFGSSKKVEEKKEIEIQSSTTEEKYESK